MNEDEEKILFVDDDVNFLNGLKRSLKYTFNVKVASNGPDGLSVLRNNGPFAVVVSDFQMPMQNGVDFLTEVKKIYPNAVRILFSGHTHLAIALEAVNLGHVYQIISKPISPEKLTMVLRSALDYYNLVMGEKILLEQTFTGALDTLLDIVGFMNPQLFSRTLRIKGQVTKLAEYMKAPELWKYQVSANLSQLGTVILPESVVMKINKGETLQADEIGMVEHYPRIGGALIQNIPRMGDIAKIVTYQHKHFDGTGVPKDDVRGDDIPFGARLLKVALDYDDLRMKGQSVDSRLTIMKQREGLYDPKVLKALEEIVTLWFSPETTSLALSDLRPGMIVLEGVLTKDGDCLIPEGEEITELIVTRLHSWTRLYKIREPIPVAPVTWCEAIHL